jgi:hypothetical protein
MSVENSSSAWRVVSVTCSGTASGVHRGVPQLVAFISPRPLKRWIVVLGQLLAAPRRPAARPSRSGRVDVLVLSGPLDLVQRRLGEVDEPASTSGRMNRNSNVSSRVRMCLTVHVGVGHPARSCGSAASRCRSLVHPVPSAEMIACTSVLASTPVGCALLDV